MRRLCCIGLQAAADRGRIGILSILPTFKSTIEIVGWIVYNMFNKAADTIAYTYPFPAKVMNKNSTFTLSERGCYFLWLTYSKIATTSIPKVSNTMNSSYVLIENASFHLRLGTEVFTPYRLPLLSILYCQRSNLPLKLWDGLCIICLTREPEGECVSPDPAKN